MKIRTLAPMSIDHKRVEAGKVVEVQDGHARMMIYAGRAEAVDKAVAPPEDANKPQDALSAAFGADVAELLRTSGFADPAAVAAASDDDLQAIKGIGAATVKKIREAIEA